MRRLIGVLFLAAAASVRAQNVGNVEQLPGPKQILADFSKTADQAPAPVPAPPPPTANPAPLTQKDLMAMSRDKLDALYQTLPAGPIPDGDSKGRATLSAGSGFGAGSEKVLGVFWQGKIFHRIDAQNGELVNKILGAPAIKAKVYYDKSLLDGEDSIILDYSCVPDLVIHNIRDEIRMAAPGIYFGYAYFKGPFGWSKKPLIFALDFNK